jgi:hypothetical protein
VRRLGVALVAITASCALGPTAASAQQVDPAVDDLRDNDVTFEEGALSSSELDELDAAAAELQSHDGYFKVVVLGEPIEDFDTGRDYADQVREGLGGQGRVLVWTPNEVALSSNLDTPEELDAAEQAAADGINSGGSLASATGAGAEALGADPGGVTADEGNRGGFPWLLLLLVVGIPVLVLWVMWRSARKQRERATALSAEEIGAAETKVRSAVDKVANDLLELADKTDLPDAPAEARAAFSQGAQLFTETQKLLEEADTRPELEAAYRERVEAGWHMDTTRALLAGQPPPPEPEPDALFPEPVVVTAPAGASPGQLPGGLEAPRPEPQYRKPDLSPWISAAAMAAMAMLSRRGMAKPQTRPPMDDGAFGQWAGGLPPSPSGSRSSGGMSGGGGRRVVLPSGRSRGRGMGRRKP